MSAPGNPITTATPGLINASAPEITPAPAGTPQNLLTTATPPPATETPPTPVPVTAPATSPYEAKQYDVTPEMTVAGQIKNIIASGSPLMQQAETNAKNVMNQRGLINSSQAIGAAQDSVYKAATPIAVADAAAYQKAASENTAAGNKALEFNAGAENAAEIAKLQADTTLSAQDMQNKTSVLVADTQAKLQTYLGQLQSNTSLTAQQMASEAQKAINAANNVSAQLIARIQSDTSLSIEQMQNQSAQVIAAMNNENARVVQDMVNKAALDNIKANGVINTEIQRMTDANKTLLQTSASASQIYTQMLTSMSNIMTNKDLSAEQKQTALNNNVQQLNDALAVLSKISGIQGLESLLDFGPASGGGGANAPASNTGPTYDDPNEQAAYGILSGTLGKASLGQGVVAYTDSGGNQYDSYGNYLGTA